MRSRELVEIALTILVAWNGGEDPDQVAVEQLRSAFPVWSQLPADELACQVIHELSSVAFRQSDSNPPIESVA